MPKHLAYGLMAVFGGFAAQAQTILIRGKISNPSGQPVSGAVVALSGQKLKDTTASDGMYSLSGTVNGVRSRSVPGAGHFAMDGNFLELALSRSLPVRIEVLDVRGNLLRSEVMAEPVAGAYRWDFSKIASSGNMMIIRASIGRRTGTLRHFPLIGSGHAAQSAAPDHSPTAVRLSATTAAAVDTLQVSAAGFAPKSVPLSRYDSTVDVVLVPNPDAFLGGFFPLAVDGPKPTDFAHSTDCSPTPATGDYGGWKSCGINTIARGPDCSDQSCPDAHDARVTAAGLRMIRAPLSNPAADAAKHGDDGLLLAWAQRDEPDANGGLDGNMAALRARYTALKAVPGHPPVYLNVGGSDLLVTNQPYATAFGYADWVADDIYPVSGFLDGRLARNDLTLVGRVLDRFQEVAPGKPRFAWIETNDILGKGDPTPAQVRAEIWIAIVHGARGILYFQEQVEPVFDLLSTTGAVRAEMGRQHAIIARLAPVIQGEIDPAGVGAAGPAALEIGWRRGGDATYVIAVNPTGTARSAQALTLTGAGAGSVDVFGEARSLTRTGATITDDFPAYGVHIYAVPKGP